MELPLVFNASFSDLVRAGFDEGVVVLLIEFSPSVFQYFVGTAGPPAQMK
jgi:hypothetical protein